MPAKSTNIYYNIIILIYVSKRMNSSDAESVKNTWTTLSFSPRPIPPPPLRTGSAWKLDRQRGC